MEQTIALFIPYLFILVGGAILISSAYFKFRRQHDMQLTLRNAIEKGQELPIEVLEAINKPKPDANRDLRRGVILISLAVGSAAIGIAAGANDNNDAIYLFMATAAVLLALGLGLISLWLVRKRIE